MTATNLYKAHNLESFNSLATMAVRRGDVNVRTNQADLEIFITPADTLLHETLFPDIEKFIDNNELNVTVQEGLDFTADFEEKLKEVTEEREKAIEHADKMRVYWLKADSELNTLRDQLRAVITLLEPLTK